MNNAKKVSDERDKRAVTAQAATAYYSLLLNRGKGDNEKELNRGWTTCGL